MMAASTLRTVVNLHIFSLHYILWLWPERVFNVPRNEQNYTDEIHACSSFSHLNAEALDPQNHKTNLEYLMCKKRSDTRRCVVELILLSLSLSLPCISIDSATQTNSIENTMVSLSACSLIRNARKSLSLILSLIENVIFYWLQWPNRNICDMQQYYIISFHFMSLLHGLTIA